MRFIPIYVVSKDLRSDGLVFFWGGDSKRKRANVGGGKWVKERK